MSNLTKSFFHPVLQNTSKDFVDGSSFDVQITPRLLEESSKSEKLCIDYEVNLNCHGVRSAIEDGSAAIYLDLYSKETITRVLEPLSIDGGTVEFKVGQLLGVLEVQSSVVTTERIKKYKPKGINLEYGDLTFDVSPGSLIAIGQKNLVPLFFKRIKLESLIRVQLSKDLDPDVYEISLDSDFITILMGESFHTLWDLLRSDLAVKPFLAISVYKDTFVEALSLINKSEENDEFGWAQALIARCQNLNIKVEELNSFASQNQAALKLLRELGVHKLLQSEV